MQSKELLNPVDQKLPLRTLPIKISKAGAVALEAFLGVPSNSILFQGSFFLENLRKPRENGRFWERTMVEKNGWNHPLELLMATQSVASGWTTSRLMRQTHPLRLWPSWCGRCRRTRRGTGRFAKQRPRGMRRRRWLKIEELGLRRF